MKLIKDLTPSEIDTLVAKAEGVRVEMHRGVVARRLPFAPEGPANDFARDHSCMWLFYEPTKDWSLAGSIIDREEIWVAYSRGESPDDKYSRTFYLGEDDIVSCNHLAKTTCEAAMRTFVEQYFGEKINMLDLPKIERIAIIKVEAWSKDFHEITDDDCDALIEKTVEVVTETVDDAILEASKDFSEDRLISARFIRWK